MDIRVRLSNYRCFPVDHPAEFTIGEGFTSFVGVNNSGKSALLRFFYEFRWILERAMTEPLAMLTGTHGISFPPEVSDPDELFSDITGGPIEILLSVRGLAGEGGRPAIDTVKFQVHRQVQPSVTTSVLRAGVEYPSSNGRADPRGFFMDRDGTAVLFYTELPDILRPIVKSLYLPPFRNVINIGTGSYYDIEVGEKFVKQWRKRQSGHLKAENELTDRVTEDIRRIFEFESLQINPSNDDTTLKLMVNRRSYKLNDVGSGIAEFILALSAAAFCKPSFILIDEPELHLHPSLQLDFLTTLGAYATFGVLMATHNLGLARSAASRIYSFRRDQATGAGILADFQAVPDLAEFLGGMSFAGYRALGFENVLLVEGQTDVATMQMFLRLYKKDHQVICLPLRGHTVISPEAAPKLQGVLDITTKVSAIIDSERTSARESLDSTRQGFVDLCERLRIPCHVTERRATENYLSDRAVKSVNPSASGLQPYQKLDDIRPNWSKDVNWRIAREMTKAELDATDLGAFFQQL